MNLSKEFLRQLTKVLVDVIVVFEDEGYDMSDVEMELNEICADYADDAGNGFAEFRRLLEEE